MTDVVPEVKDVVVEKEVEKPEKEDVVVEGDVQKNGDSKDKEENGTENGGGEKVEKVENGSLKENGVDEAAKDTKAEGEVCGIKRKSEVGLESSDDAAVETTESKKQKVEETAEPEVVSNGGC